MNIFEQSLYEHLLLLLLLFPNKSRICLSHAYNIYNIYKEEKIKNMVQTHPDFVLSLAAFLLSWSVFF